MTTKELIKRVRDCKSLRYFVRNNNQICYQLPYELFNEITKRLKELEELRRESMGLRAMIERERKRDNKYFDF